MRHTAGPPSHLRPPPPSTIPQPRPPKGFKLLVPGSWHSWRGGPGSPGLPTAHWQQRGLLCWVETADPEVTLDFVPTLRGESGVLVPAACLHTHTRQATEQTPRQTGTRAHRQSGRHKRQLRHPRAARPPSRLVKVQPVLPSNALNPSTAPVLSFKHPPNGAPEHPFEGCCRHHRQHTGRHY